MALTSLKIFGPFKGVSGYDHHVREFIKCLLANRVQIEIEDLPNWSEIKLPEEWQPSWRNSLLRKVDSEILLQFCMPHQMRLEPALKNVLFTMFEADRIPEAWVEPSLKADLIILPTESSRKAWIRSGIPEERTTLCPLGIDEELFKRNWGPLQLEDEHGKSLFGYQHRFMNISELRPRKNLLGLIKVWMETTTAQDDAILIMKIGEGQCGYYEMFHRDLQQLQDTLQINSGSHAPIHFIREIFPYHTMVRLYQTASHYISLSYGEGWDLPMMEAGAAGLRLIAPDHSAYSTYLDKTRAYLIPCKKIQVQRQGHLGQEDMVFFQNAFWWKPDEEKAAETIRNIIDGTIDPPLSPRHHFLENYTWTKATKKLLNILDENFG